MKKAKRNGKTPWEREGVSKSTYYRHKKKPATSMRAPAPITTRQAIAAGFAETRAGLAGRIADPLTRTRGEATAAYRARHDSEVLKSKEVAEAVERALTVTAVAQLGAQLESLPGGNGVVRLGGTIDSWRACLNALRRAGY